MYVYSNDSHAIQYDVVLTFARDVCFRQPSFYGKLTSFSTKMFVDRYTVTRNAYTPSNVIFKSVTSWYSVGND